MTTVSQRYTRQTDGQTDRQTDNTRYCYYVAQVKKINNPAMSEIYE